MVRVLYKIVVPVFLAVMGIIFILLGIRTINNRNNLPQTTAVIKSITFEENFSSDDDAPSADVYVEYTVDGQKYTSLFDEYAADFYEGKEVTVYYDPDDPSKITGASILSVVILFVFGPGALVAAVVMFIRGRSL